MDINIGKLKLRVVTAYLPHGGYNDTQIQRIYTTLTAIHQECKKERRIFVLNGDFNAEVGARKDEDLKRMVGQHGLQRENARGHRLKNWATVERLTITNTHFRKQPHKTATFVGPNKEPRQIDYVLADLKLWRHIRDAEATSDVDMGSDHQTIRLTLYKGRAINTKQNTSQPPKPKPKATPFDQVDQRTYISQLAQQLQDIQTSYQLEDKCAQIENAIAQATSQAKRETTQIATQRAERSRIWESIQARRQLTSTERKERAAISKHIQKEIKHIKQAERTKKIQNILANFKGLKHIAGIKSDNKRPYIAQMKDKHGKKQSQRRSIADIFATFYEELYKAKTTATNTDDNQFGTTTDRDGDRRGQGDCKFRELIPPFTDDEIEKAIDQLKKGRASDRKGLTAEMVKAGKEELKSALLSLYNDIIKPGTLPPKDWKETIVTVLFKSGDPQLPQNYRPIASIPLLYKLFSKMLCNRITPILEAQQPPDQAGFRATYSTEDHLFTLLQIQERASEWGQNIWIAALDFKKAFDTVEHTSLWEALQRQKVPNNYIQLLQQTIH